MKNATLTNCRKSEKSLHFWQCPCRMQNRSTAVLQCANILKKRTLLALLHLFEHTTLYILQQLYQNLCGMMKKRIEAVVSKLPKIRSEK